MTTSRKKKKKKTALTAFFVWWTCGDARRSALFWPTSDAHPSSALAMCNTKKWKCWANLFSHIKWTKLHKFCHRRNSEAETGMKCNNGTTCRRLNFSLLGHLSRFSLLSPINQLSCYFQSTIHYTVLHDLVWYKTFSRVFFFFSSLPGKSLEVM